MNNISKDILNDMLSENQKYKCTFKNNQYFVHNYSQNTSLKSVFDQITPNAKKITNLKIILNLINKFPVLYQISTINHIFKKYYQLLFISRRIPTLLSWVLVL